MSTNLNSIYSSFINNTSYIDQSSIERTIKSKDISSDLFATQLKNQKIADTYISEIKNFVPSISVTIKSMTAKDVENYYEEWKKQPVDYSGLKPNIIVSPLVLEKMESDPKYAEKMLGKIKKAAIPEGFDNATIYEYKVIVRDDGEIQTLACADFKDGKNEKTDDAEKKKAEKKKVQNKELELIYENRRIYDKWKTQTLEEEKIKSNQFIKQQYFFHTGDVNKIGTENEFIDLK